MSTSIGKQSSTLLLKLKINEADLLSDFGEIFIKEARDSSIERISNLMQGNFDTPESARLVKFYSSLSDSQKDDFKFLSILAVDSAIFRVLRMADQEIIDIKLNANHSVAPLSDGLAGELFGDHGWIKKFSTYPPTST